MSNRETSLPIFSVIDDFQQKIAHSHVVIAAPTGSGKSTQVPRFAPLPVLVVQPRRVAARSLAQRVAELEGCELGARVGYRVRDEKRASAETEILFVTPGIALRMGKERKRFRCVVLDEFHERNLEIDLLLALLLKEDAALVVMSATLDAERVAGLVKGQVLQAPGRLFPLEIEYLGQGERAPTPKGLAGRVLAGVRHGLELDEGDMLVFLPGKAEIGSVAASLRGRPGLEILPLHGGLSLKEQARIFQPTGKRRVILSTNVAETSLTVPNIRIVVDSGLVRRTRYHYGRGYLVLSAIAQDSADQRAGRAGRLGPGRVIRLWEKHTPLQPHTPPELTRQSLMPLVLGAKVWGHEAEDLAFVDMPHDYALEDARLGLVELGALDEAGALTDTGRRLFAWPIEPWLGRLLMECGQSKAGLDWLRLVAILSAKRSPYSRGDVTRSDDPDDPRLGGCDGLALLRMWREPKLAAEYGDKQAWVEARQHLKRLCGIFPRQAKAKEPLQEAELIKTLLSFHPKNAYVARRRKRHIAWSNGGTEIGLARESAIGAKEDTAAMVVLSSFAAEGRQRKLQVSATLGAKVTPKAMANAGLGVSHLGQGAFRKGRIFAEEERRYAGLSLGRREVYPTGEALRQACGQLYLEGRWQKEAARTSKKHLAARQLARELLEKGMLESFWESELGEPAPELGEWIAGRLEELGVEENDDLSLLEASDVTVEPLAEGLMQAMERQYPQWVELGDSKFEVLYDLKARQVILVCKQGTRRKPPSMHYLPPFPGFRICVEVGGNMHELRGHGR